MTPVYFGAPARHDRARLGHLPGDFTLGVPERLVSSAGDPGNSCDGPMRAMSTKSLLVLAAGKYDLKGAELGVLGSVRRGGKIPPMWNVPLVIYESTLVHRMLIVILPEQLGMFSPTVLRGKGTAGGLEALDRGSHSKVACLLTLSDLSVVESVRVSGVGPGRRGDLSSRCITARATSSPLTP